MLVDNRLIIDINIDVIINAGQGRVTFGISIAVDTEYLSHQKAYYHISTFSACGTGFNINATRLYM